MEPVRHVFAQTGHALRGSGASVSVVRSREDHEVDECQDGNDQSRIQDRQLVMLPEMIEAMQVGHPFFGGHG
jgi:hypothetical protein